MLIFMLDIYLLDYLVIIITGDIPDLFQGARYV